MLLFLFISRKPILKCYIFTTYTPLDTPEDESYETYIVSFESAINIISPRSLAIENLIVCLPLTLNLQYITFCILRTTI